MKRKEIKFAAVTAVVCATVLLCPATPKCRAAKEVSPSGQAVAGISLSINNYYKKTYSDITSVVSMTDAVLAAKKDVTQETKENSTNSQYKNIGIANVATYLNVREKADESSEIVGILPKNGGCYIYSVDKDGWAKIRSGNITGYVSSQFLITGGEVSTLAKKVGSCIATVNEVTVRIREKKSTDSATLMLIPKGEELEVLDDSDNQWLYVRVDNDKGFVSRELVDVKYQLAKATDSAEDAAVAASGGSVSTASTLRSKMVSYAKKFLGGKYVYGGTSLTSGIDCSAFMMRIYEHFGYSITRTSRSQAEAGTSIKLSKVKPGDLVFYDRDGTINHVGMYIGNGKIIHASNPRSGIKISNMYYKVPYKAVRFLED